MDIDIVISADYIDDEKIINKTVAIIDILRATSVITTAINNGCKKVIPVLTVEEAENMAKSNNREEIILGGERNAVKIKNFHCSNSPLEYTKEKVNEKTIILTTTNGTRAINKSINAKNILISALINSKATAKVIDKLNEDLIIVNSGTYGEFSMDDFICSGYLIDCLYHIRKDLNLSDIAQTAHYIYLKNKNILDFVEKAKHYERLKKLNLEKDLEYCFQKDIIDIVPEYTKGIIRKSNI